MDKNQLKIQALLEKISNLTTNYENQIADLRVDLTMTTQELQDAVQRIEEYKVREELEATAAADTDEPLADDTASEEVPD